jgi:NitT/TauT family transport system ATP-binding protein
VFESVYLAQRVGVLTPRPGRIAEFIDVPKFKNSGQKLRTCADYNTVCARVSQATEAAAEAA